MLDRRDTLPRDEIALIEALPVPPVTFGPDEEILREEFPPRPKVLLRMVSQFETRLFEKVSVK